MIPLITAIIQIGNSDDKLPQKEWAEFVRAVHKTTNDAGDIHFSGFSIPDAVWQNACWVAEIHTADIHKLRDRLRELATEYRQDSIALTVGETEFVTP